MLRVSNATDHELSDKELSLIFERFYRPDASRSSKTGGHGIGLSIAKAICDRHGAKIHAQKQGNVISIQAVFSL